MLENNLKPLVPILLRDLPACPSAAPGNADPTAIYYLNNTVSLIKENFDPIYNSAPGKTLAPSPLLLLTQHYS